MRIGIQINSFNISGGSEAIAKDVKINAQGAEAAGFASVWVMDHFFQISYLGPATDPMMEAYSTLGYIAALTEKVTLGTMVTGVIYRSPAILVKTVTTLDVLSSGRAVLGIGAGWNEEEAIGLGLSRPLQNARFERLEETLKIALRMWSGDESSIVGKHYQLEHPILSPKQIQNPHPPILIGGGGEQVTLRLVAKYADACNFFARDDVSHKLEVLRNHCQDVGTDFDRIEKTVLMSMPIGRAVEAADQVLARCKELGRLGIDHVIFSNDKEASEETFEKFGKKLSVAITDMGSD